MSAAPVTTSHIAEFLHGRLVGSPEIRITGVSGLQEATASDLSFVRKDGALKDAADTQAGALLVSHEIAGLTRPQIVVPNPALAMTKVVSAFFISSRPKKSISNLSHVGVNVRLGEDVSVWPFVAIDDNVTIGRNTQLYPGVFVGGGTSIGEECVIYPNVTIREGTVIGNRVIIHAGVVLGSDGFGYLQDSGRHHKIPQIGTVVIEDDVEIGANVTIDRATYGKTIIRRGTKIDNLVQIAHNVEIGEHNIVVAQVGIAGSSKTGHHVMIGGQAGLADHLTIGDQVMIAARSGLSRDVATGEIIAGAPALPHKTWLKAMAIVAKLPELREQLRAMQARLDKLEKSAGSASKSRSSPPTRSASRRPTLSQRSKRSGRPR